MKPHKVPPNPITQKQKTTQYKGKNEISRPNSFGSFERRVLDFFVVRQARKLYESWRSQFICLRFPAKESMIKWVALIEETTGEKNVGSSQCTSCLNVAVLGVPHFLIFSPLACFVYGEPGTTGVVEIVCQNGGPK